MSGCCSSAASISAGIDVHPAGDDHVLLAVADVEEALVVAVGDVADGLEAVAVVLLELVVLLVVVGEHRRRCGRTARPVASGPVPVTTLPSSSYRRISTIGASLPHEPGLRSWSSGRRIVFTPSSVEPYTSNSDSGGKSSTYCCLSAKLHGAALAIMIRIDERS